MAEPATTESPPRDPLCVAVRNRCQTPQPNPSLCCSLLRVSLTLGGCVETLCFWLVSLRTKIYPDECDFERHFLVSNGKFEFFIATFIFRTRNSIFKFRVCNMFHQPLPRTSNPTESAPLPTEPCPFKFTVTYSSISISILKIIATVTSPDFSTKFCYIYFCCSNII